MGFTFDACAYHLKVIRDQPTTSYKWGAYPGVAAVIEKYRLVHEINRAGSMLDNVMYFNLRLDRDMFDPRCSRSCAAESGETVHVERDGVFLRSLIVQLKIIPLPVYLENAGEERNPRGHRQPGQCIRNNAATNIFNKDLDSRNYGVGRYGRGVPVRLRRGREAHRREDPHEPGPRAGRGDGARIGSSRTASFSCRRSCSTGCSS